MGEDRFTTREIFASYGAAFAAQAALITLKYRDPNTYAKITLFASWLLPLVFAVEFNWTACIAVSLAFAVNVARMFRVMFYSSSSREEAPRFVYAQLLLFHYVAVAICLLGVAVFTGVLAYIVVFTPTDDKYAVRNLDEASRRRRIEQARFAGENLVRGMAYIFLGGYVGNMQRDLARLCHDFIHIKFIPNGARRRAKKSSSPPLPALDETRKFSGSALYRGELESFCALCAGPIVSIVNVEEQRMGDNGGKSSGATSSPAPLLFGSRRAGVPGNDDEVVDTRRANSVRLPQCGHEFHSDCLRGYAVIGKMEISPCCGEKLDTSALYAQAPWEQASNLWMDTTEMIRYFLVLFLPMSTLVYIHHFRATHRMP